MNLIVKTFFFLVLFQKIKKKMRSTVNYYLKFLIMYTKLLFNNNKKLTGDHEYL